MSYYVSKILNIINTPIKLQKQDNSKAFLAKNIYMYATKFMDSIFYVLIQVNGIVENS